MLFDTPELIGDIDEGAVRLKDKMVYSLLSIGYIVIIVSFSSNLFLLSSLERVP